MPWKQIFPDYSETFDKLSVMVKRLIQFTPFAILGILLAGCPKQPEPNPNDTMLSGGTVNDGSFVRNPDPGFGDPYSDSMSDPGEGLFEREAGFTDGRMEGVLPSVYFDYDQSFIREDQRSFLMEAYEYMKNNPNYNLLIEGYCDYKGTTEYNIALGDRRANSVKTFLTQLGLEESRIETLSKGDLEAVEDADDEQRQLDRRADLVVVQ